MLMHANAYIRSFNAEQHPVELVKVHFENLDQTEQTNLLGYRTALGSLRQKNYV